MAPAHASMEPGLTARYVLFTVGDVEYGVAATSVRRQLRVGEASRTRTLDLRDAFRLPGTTEPRPMLVVDGERGEIALVVDELLDGADIDGGAVQELPAAFGGAERHWFRGLARLGDRLVILVDVDGLLS
jgi:chemotaxis signal transduction protein